MSAAKRNSGVDPLSRAAWDRIESKLFEALDRGEHLAPAPPIKEARKPWRWRAGAAIATLAAAAAAALLWKGQLVSPEPALAERESAPAAMPATTAQAHPFLVDGSRIETTTAAVQSTIGESILDIAAQSSLRVSGDDARGWLIQLETGRVDCKVAPRHGRPPFVVEGGETRITVVGTRFSVERLDAGSRVVVQEGIVRVQSGEQSVLLTPGQRWPDDSGVAPAPPAQAPRRTFPAHSVTRAEQLRFERAARLEATDPQAALRIYRELDRHSAWSANALYARGRLELTLGQPRGKQDLERYLKRYPNGPNAADVRALLDRAAPSR